MRTSSIAVLIALILTVLGAQDGSEGHQVNLAHATNSPCDGVPGNAGPPISQPPPYISGTIVNASTSAGISGVDVSLYRCIGTTSTYVTTQTSGSGGVYSFTGLSYPYWYYVEVDTSSGPGGLDPVWPTINPSALIEVGDGLSGLTLSFD